MTTFYICRHGQTENNKHKHLSGWVDTPLTEEGVQNAASCARKLGGTQFDTVISSDLGRAFITAYLIAREIGFSSAIERAAALREVDYGDFSNLPYTGPQAVYPELSPFENTNFTPPNGESLLHMQARVVTYINDLGRDNPGKTILLVAHDGTVNALRASFMNQDIGLVDANSTNAQDFVGRFVYDSGQITSFEEILYRPGF